MFRQVISRGFSISTRRSNLVADLYINNIKSFKPTPLATKDLEGAVKAFQLPSKPTLPAEEISSDLLNEYESAEVETVTVAAGAEPVEEEWFVFEEPAEEHH